MKKLLLLSLLLSSGPLAAGEQAAVRRAVAEGRLRPLTEIIATVQARHPGRIVDVELERVRGGAYVYEIEILTPDRGTLEVKVDGATGGIIEPGGPAARGHRPLPELLREVQARYPGHVIDVELEHGSYQVELAREDGRRLHVVIDPATGATVEDAARDAGLGGMRPMADVIEAVLQRYRGTLVEGELERTDDGRHFYELEIVGDDGQEYAVRVDAVSGEVLREDAD